MKTNGLTGCFQVSRKLRYINYLGDGDLKLFLKISKLDIYPQRQVKKQEYVVHIQKGLGNGLTKIKSTKKGPLSDGKSLDRKGRLTLVSEFFFFLV